MLYDQVFMERVSFAISMASSGALDCSGVWHVSCIAGASTRSGSELCARRTASFLVRLILSRLIFTYQGCAHTRVYSFVSTGTATTPILSLVALLLRRDAQVLGAAVAPHSGRRLVFARDRGLEL